MADSTNILYTTPSGEHITARRSTRAKFLQLETTQLKAYITDLESSLGTNKVLLKELADSIKSESPVDRAFTARMIKDMESENLALEERIRRVTIEKNDACLKAQGSDRLVRDVLTRELSGEHPLEGELRRRREILEEKEGRVQQLDSRCKQLIDEIEEHDRLREQMLSNDKESSLKLTEKYVRLKEIFEKLQRELSKVIESKAELEENCAQLHAELQKVNAVLKCPITRNQRTEEFLNQSDDWDPQSDYPVDTASEELIQSEFLVRQLEVLHAQQRSKSLSKKIPLAMTDFNSQTEQKCVACRLTAEVGKLADKIKDLQIKKETLMDELKSNKRLNVALQQDNYRLHTALETLRHKLRSYEDDLPQGVSKTLSINPRLQHSITPHSVNKKKKRRAASNPLEYLAEAEPIAPPLTSRGPKVETAEAEESLDMVEFSPEMPSIIRRADGDEFLQGDSFLVDAFHLRNK